jgi:hypothetical protein
MSFKAGDIVNVMRLGKALWCVEELGEQTFYNDGSPCSEESTLLSLYLPSPPYPRSAYSPKIWAHREHMLPVAAMEVIAMTVNAPSDTEARQLEMKFRSRLKRLRQLRVQAATFRKHKERTAARKRLKDFEKQNLDLLSIPKLVEEES